MNTNRPLDCSCLSLNYDVSCYYSSDKSKRNDTGKYELTLRNAKGDVKIPIDVTVIGK
jgi:hypothetical protein